MGKRAALRDLSLALRGAPDPAADWMGVLAMANQALATPQIHAAALAADTLDDLPDEVRTFTADVFARNRARNARLFEQLHDAVAALNGAGIEPVLLKGCALWAALGRPDHFDRLTGDLDLLVRPAEAPRAAAALRMAGFDQVSAYAGPAVHVVAEFGRPQDVGFVDLHQRPPGPPALAEIEDLEARCQSCEWRGLRAKVPDPAAQVFFLVLHDQFHEAGYWRGGLALRHLTDIALLSHGPAGVDWADVDRLAATRLARRALRAELAAAVRIAGANVPPAAWADPWTRLQAARHTAQFLWPATRLPLAGLAMLAELPALIAHRRADAAGRARMFGRQPISLAERLQRLTELVRPPQAGRL